jgi:hypothetical protein
MRSTAFLSLLLGLLLVVLPARTQNVNLRHPGEIHSGQVSSPEAMKARMNNMQLQADAKELAELCASMPAEMDGVRHGLLPQDVLEKLKRLEKLSKHLRVELMQ